MGKIARLLLVPVLAGLGVTIVVYTALGPEPSLPDSGERVTVLVAKEPVAARSELRPEQFELRPVPPDVAAGAVQDAAVIKGRLVAVPLVAGEILLSAKLVDPDKATLAYRIPEGMRALTLQVDEFSGVGGYPVPGDRVDLVLVLAAETESGSRVPAQARLLLEDVLVLARGPNREPQPGQGGGNTLAGSGQSSFSSYTLAFTPQQAATVSLANEVGHFRLLLRPVLNPGQHGELVVTEHRFR